MFHLETFFRVTETMVKTRPTIAVIPPTGMVITSRKSAAVALEESDSFHMLCPGEVLTLAMIKGKNAMTTPTIMVMIPVVPMVFRTGAGESALVTSLT